LSKDVFEYFFSKLVAYKMPFRAAFQAALELSKASNLSKEVFKKIPIKREEHKMSKICFFKLLRI